MPSPTPPTPSPTPVPPTPTDTTTPSRTSTSTYTPTYTPTPTWTLTPTPYNPYGSLQDALLSEARNSDIGIDAYAYERDLFIGALIAHLDDFASGKITTSAMVNALQGVDAGHRVNGAVRRIWKDWLRDTARRGIIPQNDEPQQSRFRNLVIRMIQGRQATLDAWEQKALYSYFTRRESHNTWNDNMDGVIGAIHQGR